MKTTVFFDLDGTLTDSRRGILCGFAHALTVLGRPTTPDELTDELIGPPLYVGFHDYYGFPEAEACRGVEIYREYYGREGLFVNEVYPGIPEMLARLKEAGLTLALATGKPHPYARRILEHFGLLPYFTAVFGAEFDGTRGDKGELLTYAMEEMGVTPRNSLMVGDRRYDVRGALDVGATPVGVLWGYGDSEELRAAGCRALAATPSAACELILDLAK